MMEKLTGTVLWFNDKKGFGFIDYDNEDYFVHYKSICSKGFKTLKKEQKVEFTPSRCDRGLVAEKVTVIS